MPSSTTPLLSTPTVTPPPTEEPTPTATATEMAYLGGRAGLAAPMLASEPAPALASLGVPGTITHRVITYTYPSTLLRTGDSLYRLITATYSSGQFYHYTYDAVGNRQSLTTHQDVVNYQYDDANRLTSVNGQTYNWDDNGNLLSDGLRSYTYDHANRLTQVVSGTLTTQFTYNGAGDRVAKTVDGVTTAYVLDPAAGLTQVLQEATDGQATSYLYGHDLLAQYDSGTWAYHVDDGLGSVRQLVDPTGQVVQGYSFSPFGVPLGESGGEPYGFTGEQWDASAGLVFLRARYYASDVGRFISRDPFPGCADSPQSLNRWVYVRNNPVGLVDPSGLQEPVPVPTPGQPVVPEDTPAPSGGPQAAPTPPPGVPTPPTTGTPVPTETPQVKPTSYGGANVLPDGFVVGRATNLTGGIAGVRWLNAVHQWAGACQLPHGQIFNVAGFGTETVYDFVHRQKQEFNFAYYGIDPLQLLGFEHSWYEGLAMGFQGVEDIGNYAGLNLVKAPPMGLSFSAIILEAGGGMSFSEAIQRPGVDVVVFGLNLEFGFGWPGPALEEGGTGVYWGLTAVAPADDTPDDIPDLATLESEIRSSTLLITEVAIQSARFWWYWGAQQ